MLQVTDQAVSVFKGVIGTERPDGGAIRIGTGVTPEGEPALEFGVVEGPREGDAAAEAPGIEIFLAPELVAPLDDAILDARQSQEGAELFLRAQQPPQG